MINFIKFLNQEHGNPLFVENPIILHAQTDNTSQNLNFFVNLNLQPENKIISLESKVIDQETVLDLSPVLRDYLEFVLPDLAQNTSVQYISKNKHLFTIEYGLKDESGTILESVQGSSYFYFLGGIYEDIYPDFTDVIIYLSNKPSFQKVSLKTLEYEFLYLMPRGSTFNVTATIFKNQGANDVDSDFFTSANGTDVNVIPAFPLWRLLHDKNLKDAWRVVFQILDNLGNSKTITYDIDRVERRYNRIFIYQNALGGYDTLVCTGQRTKETEVDRKLYEKLLDYNYKASDSKRVQYKSEKIVSFKIETGYLSKAQIELLMRDFLDSPQRFEVVNGKPKSILIVTKKIDYDEDIIKPQSVQFEYIYAL